MTISTATDTSASAATRPATGRATPATPRTTGSRRTPTSPPTCSGATSGVRRTLDVGCARGYLVEALRELGVDAHGCDVSGYAVEHAAPGALGYVRLGDLVARACRTATASSSWSPRSRSSSTCRRPRCRPRWPSCVGVCGGVVYATIPSFGHNASGPDGHLDGKVRPERLADYEALGDGLTGPIPAEDLAVDADGGPIEGHLTIASFDWWTARFADAGFDRWADVEQRLYADIAPAGLGRFWNLYVFAVPDTPIELATPRQPEAHFASTSGSSTRSSSTRRWRPPPPRTAEHPAPAGSGRPAQATVTSVPIGVIGQTTAALDGGISTQPSLWGSRSCRGRTRGGRRRR